MAGKYDVSVEPGHAIVSAIGDGALQAVH
jgi:hypothetical protein